MSTHASGERFLAALVAVAGEPGSADQLDAAFVRSLLDFGSETDDNTRSTARVGVRELVGPGGKRRLGLALRHGDIPLADIVNAAEGSALPPSIAEDYPSVSQEDWDAILRLTTLILAAIESKDLDA